MPIAAWSERRASPATSATARTWRHEARRRRRLVHCADADRSASTLRAAEVQEDPDNLDWSTDIGLDPPHHIMNHLHASW